MILRGLVCLIFFTLSFILFGNDHKNKYSGIAFKSHEEVIDLRTGINFTPNSMMEFEGSSELSFDLSLRRNKRIFGYIFRIITDNGLNIDLVSRINSLVIIVGDSTTNLSYHLNRFGKPGNWNKVKLSINKPNGTISLTLNNETKSKVMEVGFNSYSLYFGKNDSKEFSTTDVPPIIIRNVIVKSGDKVIRNWPLFKHHGSSIADEINQELAVITNPIWLSDQHINWSHLRSITTSTRPQLLYDNNGQLLLVTEDALRSINVDLNELKIEKLKNNANLPVAQQSIYLSDRNEVWVFDFDANQRNILDTSQKEWIEQQSEFTLEPTLWHINKAVTLSEKMVFFGGYGYHTYYNNVIEYSSDGWNKWNAGEIEPRYLSAMGINEKDEVFVFGGYGSKSGRQEQKPQPFYQLHKIDLENKTSEKIWEIEDIEGDFVFSNSMVFQGDSVFYVLKYPRNKYLSPINLERYNYKSKTKTTFSDSLDFKFHDVSSYADLFYNETNQKLIAVLLIKEGSNYETHIYTIKLPALLPSDVFQEIQTQSSFISYKWILAGIGGIFLLIIIIRKTNSKESKDATESEQPPEIEMEKSSLDAMSKNSALKLMGKFQVVDKDENDISDKFTSTLKSLLALLLLFSVRNNKGVTSAMIWETIWPDKPENKARNNRNVNIKKLRETLKEVGDISITNNGEYWFIDLGEDVYFDYGYTKKILNDKNYNTIDIVRLAKKGNIFPAIETDWIDGFKSEFSNELVDHLLTMSKHFENDAHLLVEIADAIFMHDIINQDALVMKCKSLNKTGKFALAKHCYDSFAHEYKLMYDEDFQMTFESIIH